MKEIQGRRSPKPYSSAEEIERSEDLLMEILLRMGAVTLIRFKCVSKRWCTLISSPYFSDRHVRRHANITKVTGILLEPEEDDDNRYTVNHNEIKPLLFETARYRSSSPLASVDIDPEDSAYLIQSCNGLLLCKIIHSYSNDVLPPESFFVCNPTTNSFTFLPDPYKALESHESPWLYMNFAFDPSVSSEYTVICVWKMHEDSPSYETMVYSSENQSWRQCGSPLMAPANLGLHYGVYFNGSIHWICFDDDHDEMSLSLRFDLTEELLRDDTMPPVPDLDYFYFPAVACGHLNLVGFGDVSTYINIIRVYQMTNDYSEWVLLHTVDLSLHWSYDIISSFDFAFKVLHLIPDPAEEAGDCSHMSLVMVVNSSLVLFRLKDHTLQPICDYFLKSSNQWLHSPPISFEYIESLVQL
ncbi:hypothetical protein PIB30_073590 [Stylosanthes scabra]|uniref:F-box domain-containing protein n=1 Tax=Stylosanthes scabra TaxID=79078 RepID=A0ABU6TQY9_9FABA|nr:hypothetical protein [Stylosanthes scabra]